MALGTVLFVLGGICGMVSVDAAMSDTYSALVDATIEEIEDTPDQTPEYESPITPEEEAHMYLGDGESEKDIMLTSSHKDFKWTVETNSIVYSSAVNVKKGDFITISVSPNPSNSKMQIGIITPANTKKYIVCTGKRVHTFTIPKDGNYKVFVKNCSNKKITVSGSYSAI